MATIRKTPAGRYKAILRGPDGRHLKSKTFDRKGDATAWVRRLEADQDHLAILKVRESQ